MCGKACHSTCVRSANNFVEFSPFFLMWVLGIEARPPGLHSKHRYLLIRSWALAAFLVPTPLTFLTPVHTEFYSKVCQIFSSYYSL